MVSTTASQMFLIENRAWHEYFSTDSDTNRHLVVRRQLPNLCLPHRAVIPDGWCVDRPVRRLYVG
jgi:hypothetical protein